MTLTKDYTINKLWKQGGVIKGVDFTLKFSDPALYPGTESVHAGVIPVHGILEPAVPAAIIAAIEDFLAPQMFDIENFHADRLAFDYLLATSTQVEVTPAPALAKQPQLVAQARLKIDGWEVTGMNGDSGISGATPFDIGLTWCAFKEPLGFDDYIVTPSTGNTHRCFVNPDEQSSEGFLLYTETLTGEPSFPACVQLVVSR